MLYGGIPKNGNKKIIPAINAIQRANAGNQPAVLPAFRSLVDGSGNLNDSYASKDVMDTRALDAYRNEALRKSGENSAWGNLMLQKLQQEKLANIDSLSNQTSSGRAQALSDLASSGGVDGGARERTLGSFNRNAMLERQKLNRDASNKNLDILTKDEENRIGQLGNLTNMENQRATYLSQLDQFNIGNKFKETQSKRDYDMNKYNKQMETWAANKQADAQSRNACFAPDTLVTMKDGSKKRIADIRLGDELLLGGKVTMVLSFLRKPSDVVYNYMGVFVTAMHAVYENREFIRVKDSKIAVEVQDAAIPVVYNISTENHVILSQGTVFGDYDEVTIVDEEMARKELTNEFRRFVS